MRDTTLTPSPLSRCTGEGYHPHPLVPLSRARCGRGDSGVRGAKDGRGVGGEGGQPREPAVVTRQPRAAADPVEQGRCWSQHGGDPAPTGRAGAIHGGTLTRQQVQSSRPQRDTWRPTHHRASGDLDTLQFARRSFSAVWHGWRSQLLPRPASLVSGLLDPSLDEHSARKLIRNPRWRFSIDTPSSRWGTAASGIPGDAGTEPSRPSARRTARTPRAQATAEILFRGAAPYCPLCRDVCCALSRRQGASSFDTFWALALPHPALTEASGNSLHRPRASSRRKAAR